METGHVAPRRSRRRWPPIVGILLFMSGIPGRLDDAETWLKWIQLSPELSAFLMGAGALALVFSAWTYADRWRPTVRRFWGFLSRTDSLLPPVKTWPLLPRMVAFLFFVTFVAVVFPVVYYGLAAFWIWILSLGQVPYEEIYRDLVEGYKEWSARRR